MARGGYGSYWAPYVPVAERRRKAVQTARSLEKSGRKLAPVVIPGRTIARTFWGKAWCDNLEAYSDYENRLPRGRTYARNGSVIDLQVQPGSVTALVSGSSMYRITIRVSALPASRFRALCDDCSGAIDSVIELLGGRLSRGVMERLCKKDTGLFPAPAELDFACSCPDWASMCKHVAAALYGVGARLDDRPELLFTLRQVDQADLVAKVSAEALLGDASDAAPLDDEGLESLFGIELDGPEPRAEPIREPLVDASEPNPDDLLTARDLLDEGIPRSTFQNWVTAGHLRRTTKRGVYLVTEAGWERINRYVAEMAEA